MKRAYFVSFGLAAALLGCGDNTKKCDPGTTMDVDGVCTGTPTTCTDGTILVDGSCVIDPNSCQDGTVLVGGACVDPGHVDADIEEAAEPNALGLFGEESTASAGEISLKPVGQHFVLHGKIVPFQDVDGDGQQDPDVDTYTIEVTGPVMLKVSSDGLHGLAAGFVSIASVGATHPLAAWTRFGINPVGDTSNRMLYLPAAGTYILAVADSRTLLLAGAAPAPAEGEPEFEYYVDVELVNVTPTALTPTAGVATSMGQLQPGEVKLFSIAMGEGVNDVDLDVAIEQVTESIVIANTHNTELTIKDVTDGDQGVVTASTSVVGIRTNDQTIVVVDNLFDYAMEPYDYDLRIGVGGAGALSTSGGDVNQPAVPGSFSTFYYDVATDNVIGMNLHFSRQVTGVIIDENFFIYSRFTFTGTGFAGVFQDYRGLLNHQRSGRYYFLVFDPSGGTANITATSTYSPVVPVTITKGTPVTNQMLNVYGSNAHFYDAGVTTDPWQEFTGSGTGTGTVQVFFYRPTASFGRLDPLANSCGTPCEDRPVAVFAHGYAQTGTTLGRILLDDMTSSYFIRVRPVTQTGTPAYNLDFKPRVITDLGSVNAGASATRMDQAIDATTTIQRYLVRTPNGNGVHITTHPDQATLDTSFTLRNRDEVGIGTVNNGIAGADDTFSGIQTGNGWTAFTVTSLAPIVGGTFDLTVSTTAPATYARSTGTTAFSDACTGGNVVAMSDPDEGRSNATIATPAGFDFFSFAAPNVRVFANGFLAFDTNLACPNGANDCFFSNADIPLAASPNGIVAPYWDDLVVTGVCEKTVGTTLTIQWTGTTFTGAQAVQFQAILDGANDTIEYVYSSTQVANGSGATIGIENQVGSVASKVGFNTAMSIAPTLFTPN